MTCSVSLFHADVIVEVTLLTPFYQKASSAIFQFSATLFTWLTRTDLQMCKILVAKIQAAIYHHKGPDHKEGCL